jgi:transposase InsO family protein
VENESGRKIKCLRSDGGKEYFSGQFNDYLQQMGIRREFSCTYVPEQNGVAERKNHSIVKAARAMLEEKSMPKLY